MTDRRKMWRLEPWFNSASRIPARLVTLYLRLPEKDNRPVMWRMTPAAARETAAALLSLADAAEREA